MNNLKTIFIFASFLIVSCSDKNDQIATNIENIEKRNSLSNEQLLEIESIGVLHNVAMDYIGSLPNFDDFNLINISEHLIEFNAQEIDGYEITPEDLNYTDLENQKTLTEIATELEFSVEGISSVQLFEAQLINFYEMQTYEIDNVVEIISDFEFEIANSSLSQLEKSIILETSSVAKYSILYWHDASINENNSWHEGIVHDDKRIYNADVPESIKSIAQDRLNHPQGIAPNISLRTWIDLHAYLSSWNETKGGIFDDTFRKQVASTNAQMYSSWMVFSAW